jgi:hypothetical protein
MKFLIFAGLGGICLAKHFFTEMLNEHFDHELISGIPTQLLAAKMKEKAKPSSTLTSIKAESTEGFLTMTYYLEDPCVSSREFGTAFVPLGVCQPDRKTSTIYVSADEDSFSFIEYSDKFCTEPKPGYPMTINYGDNECFGGNTIFGYQYSLPGIDDNAVGM